MGTARRQYTDEFKLEAVGLLASSGGPLSQIAQELGIAASRLRAWRSTSGGEHAGSPRRALIIAIPREKPAPRLIHATIPIVRVSGLVAPGRPDSHSDRPFGGLAPQGVPEWPDPHSDRPRCVCFPGPVGRPGTPCGEVLPRRCM